MSYSNYNKEITVGSAVIGTVKVIVRAFSEWMDDFTHIWVEDTTKTGDNANGFSVTLPGYMPVADRDSLWLALVAQLRRYDLDCGLQQAVGTAIGNTVGWKAIMGHWGADEPDEWYDHQMVYLQAITRWAGFEPWTPPYIAEDYTLGLWDNLEDDPYQDLLTQEGTRKTACQAENGPWGFAHRKWSGDEGRRRGEGQTGNAFDQPIAGHMGAIRVVPAREYTFRSPRWVASYEGATYGRTVYITETYSSPEYRYHGRAAKFSSGFRQPKGIAPMPRDGGPNGNPSVLWEAM